MQLSKRLSAVAEFVTPGGCLVDVDFKKEDICLSLTQ